MYRAGPRFCYPSGYLSHLKVQIYDRKIGNQSWSMDGIQNLFLIVEKAPDIQHNDTQHNYKYAALCIMTLSIGFRKHAVI